MGRRRIENALRVAIALATCASSMRPEEKANASTPTSAAASASKSGLAVCSGVGDADAPRVDPGEHLKTNVTEVHSGKRPHLVLVILDDVGWNNVGGWNGGVSGDQYPVTPAIDAAVAEGIRLQNLYVQPMCSPTRAAVMTGRFPHRYGAQSFVQRPYQPTFLPDDETTLADKLLHAGYHTALVGKWHLGYGLVKYTPTARGFNHFYGSYEVGGDHFTHTVGLGTHALGEGFVVTDGYLQTLDLHREESATGRKRDSHRYVTDQRGVFSTEMIARESIKEINAAADSGQPLFLYAAFTTIHTPLQVPPKYVARNAHIKGSWEAKTNAGMVTAMDAGIGDIIEALKARDMWKDTVMVCFTDNGAMVTQGASNFPLRGTKMGPFEGGIRSVGFVSGGHEDVRKAAGRTYQGMLHAVDVHSILAHVGGANVDFSRHLPKKLDAMDGMALWKSVTGSPGGAAEVRTEFVGLLDPLGQIPWINAYQGWSLLGKCSAIRSGKWKLIYGYPGRDDWYPGDPAKCFNKLAHEGTLPEPPKDHPECLRGDLNYDKVSQGLTPKDTWLFNIEADPNEKTDLSAANPAVVQGLKARIAREYAEAAPPFPDRWATAIGMMEGIYHEVGVDGYGAGLASWLEPEHLAKVDCCRKARQWLRIRLANKALECRANYYLKHFKGPAKFLDEGLIDPSTICAIDDQVRIAAGLDPQTPMAGHVLVEMEAQVDAMEAHRRPLVQGS